MLTCLYKKEQICSLNIKNKYGVEDYNLIKEWELTEDRNELTCEDCGRSVHLRKGLKRTPHFSHKPGFKRECNYGSESEEYCKAISHLRNYFLLQYPNSKVKINHRFSNNKRCSMLVEFGNGQTLAIEYKRERINRVKFKDRQDYYASENMNSLWLFSNDKEKKFSAEQLDSISIFCNELPDKTAKIFDYEKNSLYLYKKMKYEINGVIKDQKDFYREYNLEKLKIKTDGTFETFFDGEFKQAEKTFIKECEEKEEKIREEERVKIEQELKRKAEENARINEYQENLRKVREQYYSRQKSVNEECDNNSISTKEEIIKMYERNPEIDILMDCNGNRWGICELCGEYTIEDDYWTIQRVKCKCKKCK